MFRESCWNLQESVYPILPSFHKSSVEVFADWKLLRIVVLNILLG
jgi:hypothetical protein